MRKLFPALAGLMLLAGCEKLDPTQKRDYECVQTFESRSACAQFRITDSEAAVALNVCEDPGGINGSWHQQACTTTGRTDGYCELPGSKYTLSGTNVNLYFYGIDPSVAKAACETDAENTWIGPSTP